MKSAADIEALARRIAFEPDAEADERILSNAEAALSSRTEAMGVERTHRKWSDLMRSRMIQLAAAVVVLVGLGVHFLGGSIDGASVALADVLAQMEEFRPYRCRVTVTEDGKEARTYTLERLSWTQRREIFPDGSIMVIDLSIPKELFLDPAKKQAREHWLDMEPLSDFDLLAQVKAMHEGNTEQLGAKPMGGHTAVGFRVSGPPNDLTLWADTHTKLPVLFQIIHGQVGRKIVLDRFAFDVSLDAALFETVAPDGFQVKKTGKGYTDVPHVSEGLAEEPLLTGLKVLAEFLDGAFPPAIELPELQQTLRQYIEDNNLSDEQVQERLLPVSDYWTRANRYINDMRHRQRVQDLHYTGHGVRLGDAQTPIMWWQPPDSPTYRVIYADLTIGDLRPDELPK
jgi:hypothetical protein